jgi:hypothetical protein
MCTIICMILFVWQVIGASVVIDDARRNQIEDLNDYSVKEAVSLCFVSLLGVAMVQMVIILVTYIKSKKQD